MSKQIELSPAELARQTREHVESLRRAGVEWMPRAVLRLREVTVAPDAELPAQVAATPASNLFQAGSSDGPSPAERRQQLAVLAEKVSSCMHCPELCSTRTQTVFGVGRVDPAICFVGEAPGADEDAQGEPFVGKAGQLLTRIIAAMGLKREDVYICNILKCRPPGNRPPQREEAEHCRDYLDKQIELVSPRSLCALGGTAATNLLKTAQSVGKMRGKLHDYKGIPVVVTYHPSYLLTGHRGSEQETQERKRLVWEDMKFLLRTLGLPIPPAAPSSPPRNQP
jgi:DNA polymerase